MTHWTCAHKCQETKRVRELQAISDGLAQLPTSPSDYAGTADRRRPQGRRE